TRNASLALLGSLVPTTLANNYFWQFQDEDARQLQQVQFFKNISVAGGLLLCASEHSTRRTRRRGKQTGDKATKSPQLSTATGSATGGRKSRKTAKKAARGKQSAKAGKKEAKKAVKR